MTTREDGHTTIVAAPAPRPWPRPFNKEVWHIVEQPNGPGQKWMSSKGRSLWSAPSEQDAVTFEERTEPDQLPGLENRICDIDSPEDIDSPILTEDEE